MKYSSQLLEDAVNAFSRLPGIGRKSAVRLVLHLLDQDSEESLQLADAITKMRKGIKRCKQCFNIADGAVCSICANNKRNRGVLCVVETIRDIMAIEETGQYNGLYHLLGGVISPIEGIGPADLNIDSLIHRIKEEKIEEIIMAVSPTIEGETTIYYISKQLKDLPVQVSTIARGVAFGGELQYADEITLGRSIVARTPYKADIE